MFSSKDLITLVFANENDIYYGEDLLKLNLDQYLWEKLHDSYEAVYFLSAEDDVFQVRTFGDRCCNAYTPGKKAWWSRSAEQTKQGEWILSQLRGKAGKTAAFVCPMEDFCSVFSDEHWESVLAQIANLKMRTGIFVLTASATAERTKELLLNSPVFDKLHETTVTSLRGGSLREMYSTIKQQKWDNCLFLNNFSWERIHALLLHLAMEHPERCEGCQQLDQMTDYLTRYLRNWDRPNPDPLLSEDMPTGYLMYRELYAQLSSQRVWDKLAQRSSSFSRCDSEQEKSSDIHVPVLRDQNGYAGRCLKMRPPQWVYTNEEEGIQTDSILQKIRRSVSAPKNRTENSRIVELAEGFIDQAAAVHEGDTDTYKQLLNALRFCVTWVYTSSDDPKYDRILDIVDKQKNLVTFSGQCFAQKRELDSVSRNLQQGPLTQKIIETNRVKIQTNERLRQNYADMVSALVLQLTMPSESSGIMQKLQELEQQIQEWEYVQPPEPDSEDDGLRVELIPDRELEPELELVPESVPEPNPVPEYDPDPDPSDDMLTLRPEDWQYNPPQY